ncbi:MAG: hypothetical protein EOM91_22325 [Sphingobacteriia bacterium]|nr:hypothetical protein [Sphingobacteriia bacterium]
MSEPAETLSRGEQLALLQLSLAAAKPGADPRPLWVSYCKQWRALAAEIAAEPTEVEPCP